MSAAETGIPEQGLGPATKAQLISRVQHAHPEFDASVVSAAYDYAQLKHAAQTRASGDPYFTHPVRVATYLAEKRLDPATVATALLHDVVEDTDVTRARPVFEVLHGYLDAACAHAAWRDGDKETAIERLTTAYERTRLDTDGDMPTAREALREAKRLKTYLDRRVDAGELPAGADTSSDVIEVAKDMRWFAVGDADPVDISRRGAIRRILRALVEKRLDAPDTPMDVHELLEAGWPDEATVGESGQQRTYMAISRLRGLGLSDVLETVDEGYLISTAYTPVWVDRE